MYLLDTNICVYYIRGRYDLMAKVRAVGLSDCIISEITVAELKFGVEKSPDEKKENNRLVFEGFVKNIEVKPITSCLDVFAREKARLTMAGMIIPDFDLLIDATAIANDLTLVTNNEKHFSRLDGIKIENWVR